jgi:type IV secretory pathway ATPase VirB11/archaellum biosynthesis ATPase
MAALSDSTVIEIMLNTDGKIWVDKMGSGMIEVGTMTAPNAEALLGTIADSLRTVITRNQPILEGELPLDGSHFEGLLPPIVAQPTFTIRKKPSMVFTLEQYAQEEILTEPHKAAVLCAILSHKNILIVAASVGMKAAHMAKDIGSAAVKTAAQRLPGGADLPLGARPGWEHGIAGNIKAKETRRKAKDTPDPTNGGGGVS